MNVSDILINSEPPYNGNGHTASLNDISLNAEDMKRIDKWAEEICSNVVTSRSEFFNQFFDRGHKINEECGYPDHMQLNASFFRDIYDSDPIARKVAQLMPKETWQSPPKVYEEESESKVTEFEEAWDQMVNALNPASVSYHQDEEGAILWEYLLRADILSGIGQFGVILLGIDDGRNLASAVDGVEVLVSNSVNGKRVVEVLPDSPPHADEIAHAKKYREDEIALNRADPGELPADECYWSRDRDCLIHTRQGRFLVNRQTGQQASYTLNNGAMTCNYVTESVPGSGPFIQGIEDKDYASTRTVGGDHVMSPTEMEWQPQLSGTDQQYFGVQFGPSERFGKPTKKKRNLLFVRVFDESLVQVVRYEWNIRNPRFGLPVMYRITLNDPRQPHSGVGLPLATVYVHWSRIIHLADNLHSSEIFGVPRMRPVINTILDDRKIRAASAEGYWQQCFTQLSFETHPQLGGDVIIDRPGMQLMMKNVRERLQRWWAVSGMSAKSIAPSVADPKTFHDIQIEVICVALDCPVRVFKGSERGELASSQDDEAWNERKRARQIIYITPKIICVFIDRLIQIGVLPQPGDEGAKKQITAHMADPTKTVRRVSGGWVITNRIVQNKAPDPTQQDTRYVSRPTASSPKAIADTRPVPQGSADIASTSSAPTKQIKPTKTGGPAKIITDGGYTVEWPDLDALGDKDKAQIALTQTQALAAFVAGNVEQVMPLLNFYTTIMQIPEEKAKEICDEAEKQQQEQEDQNQQMADEHGMVPQAPEGFQQPNYGGPPQSGGFGASQSSPGSPKPLGASPGQSGGGGLPSLTSKMQGQPAAKVPTMHVANSIVRMRLPLTIAKLESRGITVNKRMESALAKADFVILPKKIPGTNCSNCIYSDNGICEYNDEVDLRGLPVNNKTCCAYWDNPEAKRQWANEE